MTHTPITVAFSTLANQTRLDIIRCLSQGEKNVSELMRELECAQTMISHSLKKLVVGGFVHVRKEGSFHYYTLDREFSGPFLLAMNPVMDTDHDDQPLAPTSTPEESYDFIAHVDSNGTFISVTHPFEGYSCENIVGTRMFDFVAPECLSMVKRKFTQVFKTGKQTTLVSTAVTPTSRGLYECRMTPLKNGPVVTAVTIAARKLQDLTEPTLS